MTSKHAQTPAVFTGKDTLWILQYIKNMLSIGTACENVHCAHSQEHTLQVKK